MVLLYLCWRGRYGIDVIIYCTGPGCVDVVSSRLSSAATENAVHCYPSSIYNCDARTDSWFPAHEGALPWDRTRPNAQGIR